MDTKHLRAFLKIAEAGSISRAAESLRITQPSLSQKLLRLEDEVGFPLFERTTRGVILTEAGKIFERHARDIVERAEHAIAETRELREDARGQIVFAMPPSIAKLLGAQLVMAVAEDSPLIRLRVVEAFNGVIRGWLETDKIDFGILYETSLFRHLAIRRLAREEVVLVGPGGKFDSRETGADVQFSILEEEALIAPGPQHGLRQLVDRKAGQLGIKPRVVREIDSLDTMLDLVEAGQGLAVVPLCAFRSRLASGNLSSARFADGGLQRVLTLARNPAQTLSQASAKVEKLTLEIFARLSGEGLWDDMTESN